MGSPVVLTRPEICDFSDEDRLYIRIVIYKQQHQLNNELARSSQLSSPCLWACMRYGQSFTVQITLTGPLSSSLAGKDAVSGQFSTAFGFCGYICRLFYTHLPPDLRVEIEDG